MPPSPSSLISLPSERKKLDRSILDKRLSLAVAKDLPLLYDRIRAIALEGEDAEALKAISLLMDRLLGKPTERQEIALQTSGTAINNVVFFPSQLSHPQLDPDGTFLLPPES
jgi:hypothetical protein